MSEYVHCIALYCIALHVYLVSSSFLAYWLAYLLAYLPT